ncbi:nucleolar protein of 40 kda [Anaeramoeba flamelloides]|uniref:Nucleolar protein of 40 kDa n=1 Tax=Anaeramoeba flamelloides TaxID=1746091 RepID=A0AAV7YWK8_9EUKA|nr:nucleolar protein of 40 kda [Anaeramoeba flamelloides]
MERLRLLALKNKLLNELENIASLDDPVYVEFLLDLSDKSKNYKDFESNKFGNKTEENKDVKKKLLTIKIETRNEKEKEGNESVLKKEKNAIPIKLDQDNSTLQSKQNEKDKEKEKKREIEIEKEKKKSLKKESSSSSSVSLSSDSSDLSDSSESLDSSDLSDFSTTGSSSDLSSSTDSSDLTDPEKKKKKLTNHQKKKEKKKKLLKKLKEKEKLKQKKKKERKKMKKKLKEQKKQKKKEKKMKKKLIKEKENQGLSKNGDKNENKEYKEEEKESEKVVDTNSGSITKSNPMDTRVKTFKRLHKDRRRRLSRWDIDFDHKRFMVSVGQNQQRKYQGELDDEPVQFKIYQGIVTSIKEFGCFILLKGVKGKFVGLCYVKNMCKVESDQNDEFPISNEDQNNSGKQEPTDLVKKNQEVWVKVFASAGKRVALSMKEVDQKTGQDFTTRKI